MAKRNGSDDTTPEASDSANFSPTSEPMIIDGKVVDGGSVPEPEIVQAEIVHEGDDDYEPAPAVRPRNGMAQAGMFVGIASLLVNPFAATSLFAIGLSIVGIRRSMAMFKEDGEAIGRFPATIGLALGSATAMFAVFVLITDPAAS